ncbi:Phosphomannomutase 2 isoform 2 [Schistosoma japonicum]|uniref:Phosphomannomutase n=1 Tax=Schistosoma japonicum TaxID=6182 RepID=A0A4Z2DH23_SCHJA|nr:Phosphomannomutase 2 [Schistosoma japonicum]TNN15796.1 Phosphomannomutase 2 isoform 2 [Schistosoma japonicum]
MSKKVICLFDVDGTLTKPRNTITDHMLQFLIKLSSYVPLAVVSGSDFQKVSSQISPSAAEKFPFIFSENGLVVHSYGEKISSTNIVEHVGEDILQRLINFCLQYMSNLWLPRKRGNFIEFRDGLINICPVGRSCTQEERDEFADYDAKHKIRENFVAKMRSEFHSSPLQFAIELETNVYQPKLPYCTARIINTKTAIHTNHSLSKKFRYEVIKGYRLHKSFYVQGGE